GCVFFFFFFNDTATTEIYTFPYTTLFRSRVTLAPAGWLTTLHWPRPVKSLFARSEIPTCKVADDVGSSMFAWVVPLGSPNTNPYGAAILNPVWPSTGGGLES